jgi:hypothetical protein
MISILVNIVPVAFMIWLIPVIKNDVSLSVVYLGIIFVSLLIKRDKKDIIFLIFGFIGLFFSEWFFISTGVEVFLRKSLFGVMPLWLPILWGYAFVVMKRVVVILGK